MFLLQKIFKKEKENGKRKEKEKKKKTRVPSSKGRKHKSSIFIFDAFLPLNIWDDY